jgi:hypothetical protein
MATTDLINRLDKDLFKNTSIDLPELIKRLNQQTETLYTIISQIEGGTITNINTIIYSTPVPEPVVVVPPDPGSTFTPGITITRVVFNVNGETVIANFKDGILVA